MPHNPQGQTIAERASILKLVLHKQKGGIEAPRVRIMKVAFTISHLQLCKHFNLAHSEHLQLEEPLPKPQVWYRLPNGGHGGMAQYIS